MRNQPIRRFPRLSVRISFIIHSLFDLGHESTLCNKSIYRQTPHILATTFLELPSSLVIRSYTSGSIFINKVIVLMQFTQRQISADVARYKPQRKNRLKTLCIEIPLKINWLMFPKKSDIRLFTDGASICLWRFSLCAKQLAHIVQNAVLPNKVRLLVGIQAQRYS